MKRSLLYVALGAMTLSACTSESVLEDAVKSQNAIGFEDVVNKHTRADLVSNTFNKFNVFGYYITPGNENVAVPVFQDVPVTKGENNNWSYKDEDKGIEERYWVPGAHYYFFAYSCGNIVKLDGTYGSFEMDMTNNLTPAKRVLKINNYLCDYSHQHDLIYASNTGGDSFDGILGKETGNARVGLQFKHLLSKVQAQFTSSFPAGYEVIISDVKINNVRNKGNYDPTSGWDPSRSADSPYVVLAVGNSTTERGGAAATALPAYVIPYLYKTNAPTEYIHLTFYLTVKNKGEVVFTKEMSGKFQPEWEAGHSYTYNVELSGSAANLQVITFTTDTDEFGNIVSDFVAGTAPEIKIEN